MGRKNWDRYSDEDWRRAGSTVRAIIANGWPVDSVCEVCDLRIEADVKRIAREVGPDFSLWGASPRCRRKGCPGRVTFYVSPPGAIAAIAVTAKR